VPKYNRNQINSIWLHRLINVDKCGDGMTIDRYSRHFLDLCH